MNGSVSINSQLLINSIHDEIPIGLSGHTRKTSFLHLLLNAHFTDPKTSHICLILLSWQYTRKTLRSLGMVGALTFLPHRACTTRPPSSSPTGMLLMALISRPAQADRTIGLTETFAPSCNVSPRINLAVYTGCNSDKWSRSTKLAAESNCQAIPHLRT